MGLHIIIDGYNVIRQSPELLRYEKEELEKGRAMLLKKLLAYQRIKPYMITVIFDGWLEGDFFEHRDREGGIKVIFSRRGEKADEVIKRIVAHERGELVVVTSDRELGYACAVKGCPVVSAKEFLARMELACYPSLSEKLIEEDNLPRLKGTKKKGPARKLSKTARTHLALLKRL
mgnify:CR=1 FL=1